MKRTIHTVEEETEEITVCDYCGREADERLVSREEIEDHLARIEEDLRGALSDLGWPDVPEPVYTESKRPTGGRGTVPAGTTVSASTLTATVPRAAMTWPLRPGSGRAVVERDYTGIDAEEADVIEAAEELRDAKTEALTAVNTARLAIERISRLPPFRNTLDICGDCREDIFGWRVER